MSDTVTATATVTDANNETATATATAPATSTDTSTDTATTATTAPEYVKPPAEYALSLADIQNVVKIFDHAAEQGAFRGWQIIQQVFSVRVKLISFLTSVLPKVEQTASEMAEKAEGSDETTEGATATPAAA